MKTSIELKFDIDRTARIHRLAHVEDAHIGARTRVWQFASVIRGAKLGEDCNVASGACIDGSHFGDRCVIGHNLAMGPGFLIGDDVFVGPNVTFCNDAWPRASKVGFDPTAYNCLDWAIIVESGASIGAGAVILPGVRIGARAMIGANAVVSRDVEPDTRWLGYGKVTEITEERPRMRFADRDRALNDQAAVLLDAAGVESFQ